MPVVFLFTPNNQKFNLTPAQLPHSTDTHGTNPRYQEQLFLNNNIIYATIQSTEYNISQPGAVLHSVAWERALYYMLGRWW